MRSVAVVFIPGLLVSACGSPAEPQSNAVETTAAQDADFVRMATAGHMLSDLQTYLESDDSAVRTFTFDRLTFRPGTSNVRAVDRQTIYALANVLRIHPKVRVRVIGYGDGDQTGGSEDRLALQRASSIARALRTAGIDASRVEIAAGREAQRSRAPQLMVLQK